MLGTGFNEWGLIISSEGADGTRPAVNQGTSVTPGASNTFGSYTQLLAGAAVTDDVYGVFICINSVGANGLATDSIATIGLDPAGGTSYTDFISNLLCGSASPYLGAAGGPGATYYFPIFIKAGTSIAIKISQNNAAPAACRAFVRLYCRPSRPEMIRWGQRVVTYGATPASSSGTSFTTGTTSDGTYAALGTIAAGDHPWFWQLGIGLNNTTIVTSAVLHMDLAVGDGTTFNQAIQNQFVVVNTNEQVMWAAPQLAYKHGEPGQGVYARGQSSAAAATGLSAAAYGVI